MLKDILFSTYIACRITMRDPDSTILISLTALCYCIILLKNTICEIPRAWNHSKSSGRIDKIIFLFITFCQVNLKGHVAYNVTIKEFDVSDFLNIVEISHIVIGNSIRHHKSKVDLEVL